MRRPRRTDGRLGVVQDQVLPRMTGSSNCFFTPAAEPARWDNHDSTRQRRTVRNARCRTRPTSDTEQGRRSGRSRPACAVQQSDFPAVTGSETADGSVRVGRSSRTLSPASRAIQRSRSPNSGSRRPRPSNAQGVAPDATSSSARRPPSPDTLRPTKSPSNRPQETRAVEVELVFVTVSHPSIKMGAWIFRR